MPTTYEEKVRASLNLSRARFEVNQLVDLVGCSRGTLSPFMKNRGTMGAEFMRQAEMFSRREGFWLWDELHESSHEYPWEEAAADLASVSRILTSRNFTDKEKSERFAQTIFFYNRLIESIAPKIEGNDGGF